jgi:hypothetical protein
MVYVVKTSFTAKNWAPFRVQIMNIANVSQLGTSDEDSDHCSSVLGS